MDLIPKCTYIFIFINSKYKILSSCSDALLNAEIKAAVFVCVDARCPSLSVLLIYLCVDASACAFVWRWARAGAFTARCCVPLACVTTESRIEPEEREREADAAQQAASKPPEDMDREEE